MKKTCVFLALLLLCGSLLALPTTQAFAEVDFDPAQYTLEELDEILRIINMYYPKTPEGEVLYDQDGLYIEYRGIYEHSHSKWIINLYVDNATGDDKTLLLTDVRANRYNISVGNNGKTIVDDSVYLSSANYGYVIDIDDLAMYNIETLNRIDFTLGIRNGGLLGDIIADLPISINMEMTLPD